MAIFQIYDGELRAVEMTTFGAEGIYERRHIQSLLRDSIDVLGERLLVIAEEFGDWVDSSRRIDLLCLDGNANLVVVELKRTEDGGHMELQAVRYAAMVSAMTFAQAVDVFARHLNRAQVDLDEARTAILEFLGWVEIDEDRFAGDTRIILAAADFGKELTTAVMWLIDRGMDIRCVRLKPYRLDTGVVLLDIQQLIPLPEAASFQTQIGVKRQAERKGRAARHDLRFNFWEGFLPYAKDRTPLHANRSPSKDGFISGPIGRSGFQLTYTIRQTDCQVELWIGHGPGRAERNQAAFDALHTQKAEIEAAFGGELEWRELPDREGCNIRLLLPGGYNSPLDKRPQIFESLVDAMVRLDRAMRPRVLALKY